MIIKNCLKLPEREVLIAIIKMGTCRMGPKSDRTAVVDNKLKVYGISNLRVADASIMPTMLSANLNAGAMMIGEKAAEIIKNDQSNS